MFTRLLQLRGINVLATDLLDSRLALAKEFGAKWTFNVSSGSRLPDFVKKATRSQGLDAAVIAVPSDAVVRQGQELLRGGGQVLLFSHTKRGDQASLDLARVCVDEKDLIGSYSADVLIQPEVARLVFSRKARRPALNHARISLWLKTAHRSRPRRTSNRAIFEGCGSNFLRESERSWVRSSNGIG